MSDFKEKASVFASRAAGKAKQFAKFTASKTKKLSRIAKLNMDISSQRDAKRRVFTDIGRLYYETQKNPPEEELAPLFEKVNEALRNIAEMEAEIVRLKAESPEENGADAAFEAVVEADEQNAAEMAEQDAQTDGTSAPPSAEASEEPETEDKSAPSSPADEAS